MSNDVIKRAELAILETIRAYRTIGPIDGSGAAGEYALALRAQDHGHEIVWLQLRDLARAAERVIREDERAHMLAALTEAADGFIVARSDTGEEVGAFATLPVFAKIMEAAGLAGDCFPGTGREAKR